MIWDNVPIEKKGRTYADLAQLYYQLCGEKLPEPKGLRGEPEREPDIINASNYQEESLIAISREMSQSPKRQRKVE